MVIDIGEMEGETAKEKKLIVSSNFIEQRKKWLYRHYGLLMYSIRSFDVLDPIIQIFFSVSSSPSFQRNLLLYSLDGNVVVVRLKISV